MTTTADTTPPMTAVDPAERTLGKAAGVAVAIIAGGFAAFGLPGLVIVKLGMAVAGLALVVLMTRG